MIRKSITSRIFFALKALRTPPGRLRAPRGRVDEETCPGDAPETGARSNASVTFTPMRKISLVRELRISRIAQISCCFIRKIRVNPCPIKGLGASSQ